MATQRKRKSGSPKKRFIGKPTGQIQERVQAVGPDHFGVVSVDCARKRSKWMLCSYYGEVHVEPTEVSHSSGGLSAMVQMVKEACRDEQLKDCIVAVEMTGVYHKPVLNAFSKADFDTRIVHPFASNHYRRTLHPDQKTDDNDLEAIFHAAVKGFGLSLFPVSETFQALQAASRHRQNLVGQRSRLMIQIRHHLDQTMPGFIDIFGDKFFERPVPIAVATAFPSANAVRNAGTKGIADSLRQSHVRYQSRTIDRIVAWANQAAAPCELADMQTRHWKHLNELRETLCNQIQITEVDIATNLCRTPYILLLSVTGINVVSAGRLAGELGPIENYTSARAMNGRAGLYPSRYQSDEVDYADGSLPRQCNRKLRAAAVQMADNLIACHPYYRGLAELWKQRNVHPRDRRCRVANRAMRMVFQLVGGRTVWRGQGVDREYLLGKLQEFHRQHKTPAAQTIQDLEEAYEWLPKSIHAEEAVPLVELVERKQRGPQAIGELLIPLLVKLGVMQADEVESDTSEVRSSH